MGMLVGAILLLVAALVFVAIELFFPSHGVLAVFACCAAMVSVGMAYKVMPVLGLVFGLAVVIAAPIVFYWAIKIYPSTPVGKRVILNAPSDSAATAFEAESARLQELVGREGVALTMLRPSGSIEIDGRRIDSVSEAGIISPGTPVVVIKVIGLKVIVRAGATGQV